MQQQQRGSAGHSVHLNAQAQNSDDSSAQVFTPVIATPSRLIVARCEAPYLQSLVPGASSADTGNPQSQASSAQGDQAAASCALQQQLPPAEHVLLQSARQAGGLLSGAVQCLLDAPHSLLQYVHRSSECVLELQYWQPAFTPFAGSLASAHLLVAQAPGGPQPAAAQAPGAAAAESASEPLLRASMGNAPPHTGASTSSATNLRPGEQLALPAAEQPGPAEHGSNSQLRSLPWLRHVQLLCSSADEAAAIERCLTGRLRLEALARSCRHTAQM